jgi:hypothetical protein
MDSSFFYKLGFVFALIACMVFPVHAAPVTEIIETSQIWTSPTGIFIGQIDIVSGGGGGSSGNRSIIGPAGRNSTTIHITDFAFSPETQYPITIGRGGVGGISPDESVTPTAPGIGAQGLPSSAFGKTGGYAAGGYYTVPASPNGANGLLSVIKATAGQDGFGSTSATVGGTPGVGYGASGGGGGSGGSTGKGGFGGNGADGCVYITYDLDSQSVMFDGVTYDAYTGAALPSVSVRIEQGTTYGTVYSSGAGSFNFPSGYGYRIGYSTTITVTKAGYYSDSFTFVPYVSQVVPLRLSLIPTTFDIGANGTISGITKNQYGSSIPSVDVSMLSTTGSTLSMTGTSGGMYYFESVPPLTVWDATFTKAGYANITSVFDMGYYV